MATKYSSPSLLRFMYLLPIVGLLASCSSMSHRQEVRVSASTSSSPKTSAATSHFFDLDDVFARAQMPVAANQPNGKGLVCLGRQPQVLNLDTLQTDENAASRPTLLNRERVKNAIGYPQPAKDRKITGKVVVKVLVDESGHVSRFQFIQENDPILRDAVAAHVKELLFKPGLENGKPAEWWVIVPFGFGIEGC